MKWTRNLVDKADRPAPTLHLSRAKLRALEAELKTPTMMAGFTSCMATCRTTCGCP